MKLSTPVRIMIAVIVCLIVGFLALQRVGIRSGVTDAQVREALPGDEVFPDAWAVIDRAATIPAPIEHVWPWIVQLGKDRAGWYAPLWFEDLIGKHSASTTVETYEQLTVGQIIPDFGGGSLKVLAIEPGRLIEYASVPSAASSSPEDYNFTWTLVLENNTPSSTSFHLRLRIPHPQHYTFIPAWLPGLIDYATDAVLFDGLSENVTVK